MMMFVDDIAVVLLILAALLALIRLLKGPTLPDRVVALDLISVIVMCFIALFSMMSRVPIYLDIVVALAFVSFLGVLAFAQFIEWQLRDRHE
jgi:multicomponent Na+:H+ antiporter subunit F